jgi:uracil-DNA glycosylase family 4
MTDAERRAALESIAAEVRECTRCRLHATRTRAVPGEGSASTEVVFVGEGPGRDEDEQGRPFVGVSGQLLTRLIASIGWDRADVFITNVVKCRPPGNRDPQPDEITACAPFLRRQLEVLDPAVVVTLGRYSLGTFRPGERIGASHGSARPAVADTGAEDALAVAMYHPAFAVRDPRNVPTLEADMRAVPAALVAARERRAARTEGVRGAAAAAGTTAPPSMPLVPAAPAADAGAAASPPPGAGPSIDASSDPLDQLTLF